MKDNAKILIIDDDADIVETMKIILESKNYRIISAFNREDGLKKAVAEKPDLILLDVMMSSSIDGFHAAYDIRSNTDIRYTPILMITSIREKTGVRYSPDTDGEFLPVDDFIEKPVQPEDLIKRVKNLLALKKEEINIAGRTDIL